MVAHSLSCDQCQLLKLQEASIMKTLFVYGTKHMISTLLSRLIIVRLKHRKKVCQTWDGANATELWHLSLKYHKISYEILQAQTIIDTLWCSAALHYASQINFICITLFIIDILSKEKVILLFLNCFTIQQVLGLANMKIYNVDISDLPDLNLSILYL